MDDELALAARQGKSITAKSARKKIIESLKGFRRAFKRVVGQQSSDHTAIGSSGLLNACTTNESEAEAIAVPTALSVNERNDPCVPAHSARSKGALRVSFSNMLHASPQESAWSATRISDLTGRQSLISAVSKPSGSPVNPHTIPRTPAADGATWAVGKTAPQGQADTGSCIQAEQQQKHQDLGASWVHEPLLDDSKEVQALVNKCTLPTSWADAGNVPTVSARSLHISLAALTSAVVVARLVTQWTVDPEVAPHSPCHHTHTTATPSSTGLTRHELVQRHRPRRVASTLAIRALRRAITTSLNGGGPDGGSEATTSMPAGESNLANAASMRSSWHSPAEPANAQVAALGGTTVSDNDIAAPSTSMAPYGGASTPPAPALSSRRSVDAKQTAKLFQMLAQSTRHMRVANHQPSTNARVAMQQLCVSSSDISQPVDPGAEKEDVNVGEDLELLMGLLSRQETERAASPTASRSNMLYADPNPQDHTSSMRRRRGRAHSTDSPPNGVGTVIPTPHHRNSISAPRSYGQTPGSLGSEHAIIGNGTASPMATLTRTVSTPNLQDGWSMWVSSAAAEAQTSASAAQLPSLLSQGTTAAVGNAPAGATTIGGTYNHSDSIPQHSNPQNSLGSLCSPQSHSSSLVFNRASTYGLSARGSGISGLSGLSVLSGLSGLDNSTLPSTPLPTVLETGHTQSQSGRPAADYYAHQSSTVSLGWGPADKSSSLRRARSCSSMPATGHSGDGSVRRQESEKSISGRLQHAPEGQPACAQTDAAQLSGPTSGCLQPVFFNSAAAALLRMRSLSACLAHLNSQVAANPSLMLVLEELVRGAHQGRTGTLTHYIPVAQRTAQTPSPGQGATATGGGGCSGVTSGGDAILKSNSGMSGPSHRGSAEITQQQRSGAGASWLQVQFAVVNLALSDYQREPVLFIYFRAASLAIQHPVPRMPSRYSLEAVQEGKSMTQATVQLGVDDRTSAADRASALSLFGWSGLLPNSNARMLHGGAPLSKADLTRPTSMERPSHRLSLQLQQSIRCEASVAGALSSQLALLSASMAHVPCIVTILTIDGRILWQNGRSVEFCGLVYNRASQLGHSSLDHPQHTLRKLFALDTSSLDRLIQAVQQGQSWRGLVRMPVAVDLTWDCELMEPADPCAEDILKQQQQASSRTESIAPDAKIADTTPEDTDPLSQRHVTASGLACSATARTCKKSDLQNHATHPAWASDLLNTVLLGQGVGDLTAATNSMAGSPQAAQGGNVWRGLSPQVTASQPPSHCSTEELSSDVCVVQDLHETGEMCSLSDFAQASVSPVRAPEPRFAIIANLHSDSQHSAGASNTSISATVMASAADWLSGGLSKNGVSEKSTRHDTHDVTHSSSGMICIGMTEPGISLMNQDQLLSSSSPGVLSGAHAAFREKLSDPKSSDERHALASDLSLGPRDSNSSLCKTSSVGDTVPELPLHFQGGRGPKPMATVYSSSLYGQADLSSTSSAAGLSPAAGRASTAGGSVGVSGTSDIAPDVLLGANSSTRHSPDLTLHRGAREMCGSGSGRIMPLRTCSMDIEAAMHRSHAKNSAFRHVSLSGLAERAADLAMLADAPDASLDKTSGPISQPLPTLLSRTTSMARRVARVTNTAARAAHLSSHLSDAESGLLGTARALKLALTARANQVAGHTSIDIERPVRHSMDVSGSCYSPMARPTSSTRATQSGRLSISHMPTSDGSAGEVGKAPRIVEPSRYSTRGQSSLCSTEKHSADHLNQQLNRQNTVDIPPDTSGTVVVQGEACSGEPDHANHVGAPPSIAIQPAPDSKSPRLEDEEETYHWHEVELHCIEGLVAGQELLLLTHVDVTRYVAAELEVKKVLDVEHKLLEEIFPRHVLEAMAGKAVANQNTMNAMLSTGFSLSLNVTSGASGDQTSSTLSHSSDARQLSRQGSDTEVPEEKPTHSSKKMVKFRKSLDHKLAANRHGTEHDCGTGALARHHESVSILFADIASFTSMCNEVAPARVMAFLNELFTQFDELVELHGIYKVETIGDCYMAASGLLHKDADGVNAISTEVDTEHANKMLAFAQDMLRVASTVLLPMPGGKSVQLRVGIHSGPCMSGVVGRKMPRFCLFGDTINTSSRMESTGVPGCVHVSADTWHCLGATQRQSSSWRATGGVEAKGKGRLETYLWSPRPR